MDVRLDFVEGRVNVTASGAATLDGFLALVRGVVDDERFVAPMEILADYSELDMRGLTAQDMRRIADLATGRAGDFGATRAAVIAPRSLSFGMHRMGASQIESEMAVRIFDDRAAAEAWLKEGTTAADE
jgi:hypothetical protein